jgi:hypothetical protein
MINGAPQLGQTFVKYLLRPDEEVKPEEPRPKKSSKVYKNLHAAGDKNGRDKGQKKDNSIQIQQFVKE